MNIEDFINRGLAAQRAVDDLLKPCVCGHSKAEHDTMVRSGRRMFLPGRCWFERSTSDPRCSCSEYEAHDA